MHLKDVDPGNDQGRRGNESETNKNSDHDASNLASGQHLLATSTSGRRRRRGRRTGERVHSDVEKLDLWEC